MRTFIYLTFIVIMFSCSNAFTALHIYDKQGHEKFTIERDEMRLVEDYSALKAWLGKNHNLTEEAMESNKGESLMKLYVGITVKGKVITKDVWKHIYRDVFKDNKRQNITYTI